MIIEKKRLTTFVALICVLAYSKYSFSKNCMVFLTKLYI